MGPAVTSKTMTAMEKVLAYGDQISSLLHNYSINHGGRAPHGFDGHIVIFDATIATLRQLLDLVKLENDGKKVFSEKGLEYTRTLVAELASELLKLEPILIHACLSKKDRTAKEKLERKALGKNKQPIQHDFDLDIDIVKLTLDRDAFLENLENARWNVAKKPLKKCMERLYDIQVHLLLVAEVLTLGKLTSDLPMGKADLKDLVHYHDRIGKTADLLYLRVASKYADTDSDSTVDSIYLGIIDSDSDAPSIRSRGVRTRRRRIRSPPPPPPPPPASLTPHPISTPVVINSPPGIVTDHEVSTPPSYMESHVPVTENAGDSTAPNAEKSTEEADSSEKQALEKKDNDERESSKQKNTDKSATVDARLFKSKSAGLGFRIKSFFRSNQSLAEEMRQTLSNTDSCLSAWIIRRNDIRPVPHSAFHSLEATHMRTILSQLNSTDWYRTFQGLAFSEHDALNQILRPSHLPDGGAEQAELIVLKLVQKTNGAAWMALLRDLLRKHPGPQGSNGRVLLAIVREKLIDGKPLSPDLIRLPWSLPPSPTIAPLAQQKTTSLLRPPPGLTPLTLPSCKISDLRYPSRPRPVPAVPRPIGPPMLPPPPAARVGPPGPPLPRPIGMPPVNNGTSPIVAIDSVKIIDTTPITEADAIIALTTYHSYTLRLTEPVNSDHPRSWSRTSVVRESASQEDITARVTEYRTAGHNVIETKLRLTEQQNEQVTRVMEEDRGEERDQRFECQLVEISLYNSAGKIDDAEGVFGTATSMHVTTKRLPKASQKPLVLYNTLMRGGPPLMSRPPPGIAPPIPFHPLPPRNRHPRPRRPRRGNRSLSSSGSGSDTDSSSFTWSSSSSSSDNNIDMRMKLRRIKSRAYKSRVKAESKRVQKEKVRRMREAGFGESDDSSSDEEELEEVKRDRIEIKLDLKRGDDIVKVLMALWTFS